MCCSYYVAVLEDRRPFDDVSQLAYVPDPSVVLKDPFNLWRKPLELCAAALLVCPVDIVFCKDQYVLAPVPQRRHLKLDNRQAEIKVQTEITGLCLFIEIAIRCSDDA